MVWALIVAAWRRFPKILLLLLRLLLLSPKRPSGKNFCKSQIAYLQAYGKADLAANRPFTIATPCPIDSIAKTLTSLGLLALVEDGKLALDEPHETK